MRYFAQMVDPWAGIAKARSWPEQAIVRDPNIDSDWLHWYLTEQMNATICSQLIKPRNKWCTGKGKL